MKRILLLCLFALPASLLFGQKNEADSLEIRSIIQQFENSWNRNDFDAYCSFFTVDGSWINIGGMHWKNKAEVSKAMHTLAPEFKKMIPQKLNIQNIEFIASGVVVVFVLEVIQMNQDWVF